MLKSITALLFGLFAGLALVGSSSEASAHWHHSCCGGPIAPTYHYHTVHAVSHVTRYHDVSRTNYVSRPHRIVNVTRVRPIVYVHTVTRVHHHTVAVVHPYHVHVTQMLAARHIYTHSVVNTYDCLCRPHHRSCR